MQAGHPTESADRALGRAFGARQRARGVPRVGRSARDGALRPRVNPQPHGHPRHTPCHRSWQCGRFRRSRRSASRPTSRASICAATRPEVEHTDVGASIDADAHVASFAARSDPQECIAHAPEAQLPGLSFCAADAPPRSGRSASVQVLLGPPGTTHLNFAPRPARPGGRKEELGPRSLRQVAHLIRRLSCVEAHAHLIRRLSCVEAQLICHHHHHHHTIESYITCISVATNRRRTGTATAPPLRAHGALPARTVSQLWLGKVGMGARGGLAEVVASHRVWPV